MSKPWKAARASTKGLKQRIVRVNRNFIFNYIIRMIKVLLVYTSASN